MFARLPITTTCCCCRSCAGFAPSLLLWLQFALSSVCGPLLGGLLTDGPGWRFAFWINVPLGAICMVVQWFCIPPGLGQEHTATFRNAQRRLKREAEAAAAAKLAGGANAPTDAAVATTATTPAAAAASSGAPKRSRFLCCGAKQAVSRDRPRCHIMMMLRLLPR